MEMPLGRHRQVLLHTHLLQSKGYHALQDSHIYLGPSWHHTDLMTYILVKEATQACGKWSANKMILWAPVDRCYLQISRGR